MIVLRLAAGVIEASGPQGLQRWLDVCPHAGQPLSSPEGALLLQEGRYLVCAAHGASFDLTQGGLCVGGPCAGRCLTPA